MLALCLCGVVLASVACGKRGDPLPPLRRAPLPVTDLRVAQRGQQIEVRFTAPRAYTDGDRLGVIDVEVLRADREGVLEQVALVSVRRAAPGELLVETEPLPAVGTTLRFAARVREKKTRSVLASAPPLLVQPAPAAPLHVLAASFARGVLITWQPAPDAPASTSYRVYRRPKDGAYAGPLIAAPSLTAPFEDSTITMGQGVCYVVRSLTSLDPLIESVPSGEACLDVADVTPPSAPEGGAAYLQDDGSIELSWSPLLETDLQSYRIYRRIGMGQREIVAEVPASETRWRDALGAGARRVYTLTAVDRAGNESAPSAAMVLERVQ